MIRIYTISRVLSMGDTMGCGVVSIRVNRHFSRHGKLGPQEGKGLGLVYTSQKAPADNGTLRRGTTSDERKGRPCWRFHCPAWWSNSQENMQINYLQRLTRKLRLEGQYEFPSERRLPSYPQECHMDLHPEAQASHLGQPIRQPDASLRACDFVENHIYAKPSAFVPSCWPLRILLHKETGTVCPQPSAIDTGKT